MPKLHFLLLEDDPTDVELISTTLTNSSLDCDFSIVETQADFRVCIENQSVDLVIADYSLPNFTGLAAIEMVQAHYPKIPCILLSGVLGEDRAVEALKSGAADYVLKQRLDRLAPAVKRALREKEERLALEIATAALEKSEERFRTSVETMVDNFAILAAVYDEDRQIQTFTVTYLNTAACTYLSVSCDQTIGKTLFTVIPSLQHVDNIDILEAYRHVVETGEPFQEEISLQAEDFGSRWSQQFFALDMKAAKLGSGLVVTWRDITQRKQAEDQRDRLLKETQTARQQAEEASRFKDDFLGTVSHELRTPLNIIDSWLQLVLAQQLTPAMQIKALSTIYDNTQRLGRLIDDILSVSRIVQGKFRIQVQPLTFSELSRLIAIAIDTVTPAARAKNIQIVFVPCSYPAQIWGDADRLQQIMWNLLSNAVKFTPEQGGISVQLYPRDQSATITVRDTGIGISSERLSLIFERFQQDQGASPRAQRGLGLGLAIVQHIVEAHGGHIEAQSAGIDQGSTFQVWLPLNTPSENLFTAHNNVLARDVLTDDALASGYPPVSAAETGSDLVPADLKISLAGIRVLVVEDALDTRDVYQIVLQAHGAEVRVADTAAEAFEIFQQFRPQVLVSDISMPEEDGYALIRKIRALNEQVGGKTPAVALTAYVQGQYRTQALLAGFQLYIPKPVYLHELVTVVAMLA
ncbi:MAG: response regulator [Phormidesmis sp.]